MQHPFCHILFMEAATKSHPYSRGEQLDSTFWCNNLQGSERVCRSTNIAVAVSGTYTLPQVITWGNRKSSSHDQGTTSEQQWKSHMCSQSIKEGRGTQEERSDYRQVRKHCPVPAVMEGKGSRSWSFGDETWAKGHTDPWRYLLPCGEGGGAGKYELHISDLQWEREGCKLWTLKSVRGVRWQIWFSLHTVVKTSQNAVLVK